MDAEVQKELQHIKDEKIVNQQIIDGLKKQFSESLLSGEMGYEIKHCNQYPIIKMKKEKSLWIRIKEIMFRIKKTLGY